MALDPSDNLLREAIEWLEQRRSKLLEEEARKREQYVQAAAKMQHMQKKVMKWLWWESKRRETYLRTHDLSSPAFRERVKRLKSEVESAQGAWFLNLGEPHGAEFTKWQALRAFYDASQYKYDNSILWSFENLLGRKPTPSEKASLSRALGRLIKRGLVARSEVPGMIKLTEQGVIVSKWLTQKR